MSSPGSVFGRQSGVVWRLALVLALVALAGLALGGAIDSVQTGVLTMLPAVALGVLMLTRPYLGERVISRLRAIRSPRRGAVGRTAPLRRREASVARGGRLIAVALAGRAPPLALAGCR